MNFSPPEKNLSPKKLSAESSFIVIVVIFVKKNTLSAYILDLYIIHAAQSTLKPLRVLHAQRSECLLIKSSVLRVDRLFSWNYFCPVNPKGMAECRGSEEHWKSSFLRLLQPDAHHTLEPLEDPNEEIQQYSKSVATKQWKYTIVRRWSFITSGLLSSLQKIT